MKHYYTYILASQRNGTLYVGVTADLVRRVWQHKNKQFPGFTAQYAVNKLVYFETFVDVTLAIHREKRLKAWPRQWKINLIEQKNPAWVDLYHSII